MVIDPRRMPPGANLFSRGPVVYYRHAEAGGRIGYAEYDARRRAFRCPTCNYRLGAGKLTQSCEVKRCRGTLLFDGRALVCDRQPAHRINPDDLA